MVYLIILVFNYVLHVFLNRICTHKLIQPKTGALMECSVQTPTDGERAAVTDNLFVTLA